MRSPGLAYGNIYYDYLLTDGNRASCSREITRSWQLPDKHREISSSKEVSQHVSFRFDLWTTKVIIVTLLVYLRASKQGVSFLTCMGRVDSFKKNVSGMATHCLVLSSYCSPFVYGTKRYCWVPSFHYIFSDTNPYVITSIHLPDVIHFL